MCIVEGSRVREYKERCVPVYCDLKVESISSIGIARTPELEVAVSLTSSGERVRISMTESFLWWCGQSVGCQLLLLVKFKVQREGGWCNGEVNEVIVG